MMTTRASNSRKRARRRRESGTAARTWCVFLAAASCFLTSWVSSTKCKINHVHLAVGGRDASTSMTVSFATQHSKGYAWPPHGVSPKGFVKVGTSPSQLNRVLSQTTPSQQYDTVDHKGRNYTSPLYHHVTISNLEPHTRYYYQCFVHILEENHDPQDETEEGSRRYLQQRRAESSFCEQSPIHSFETAPSKGNPIRLSILGDLGRHWAAPDTIRHLEHARSNMVMLVGDIAYNGGLDSHWDLWFDFMDQESNMARIPWNVAPGNHDIEQSPKGELFAAYEKRFLMPQAKKLQSKLYKKVKITDMAHIPYPLDHDYGNSYYAFVYGPALVLVLNSYASVDPGSKQYNWFLSELQQVDRSLTPWVLVMVHCPFYNTFKAHHHDVQLVKQKEHLEPLLKEFGVNAVFSGHVHAYMRSPTVYRDRPDPQGPMHFIVGEAGQVINTYFRYETPEEWVAVRDTTSYGYGNFDIYNRTHAKWTWVHTRPSNHTENGAWLSNWTAPPVSSDTVTLHNQYYMRP